MSGWRHGQFPFGEDPGLAAEAHLSDVLNRSKVVVSLGHRIFDRQLKERQRRLAMDVAKAKVLEERDVAKALEVAEDAIADARNLLAKGTK